MNVENHSSEELLSDRSRFHPLAPIGVGTPDVESLASYFCRLALSHCVSPSNLHRIVVQTMQWQLSENYQWWQNGPNGMSDATERWANALSKLTSVEGLDSLTLLPWRKVIGQSSPRATSVRWCPACLAEDCLVGRTPYFRLTWDIGTVTACEKHAIKLTDTCSDCGGVNKRARSAFDIPGWCACCGSSLGRPGESESASPDEIWIASQVGGMLAGQSRLRIIPTRDTLTTCIRQLIDKLDDGVCQRFSQRVGVDPTSIRDWLQQNTVPNLPTALRIASQTGLTLHNFLTGNLMDWAPATITRTRLESLFPNREKRAPRPTRDWDYIRAKLIELAHSPDILCVTEAARILNIHPSALYQHAPQETRTLGRRWVEHKKGLTEQARKATIDRLEPLYLSLAAKGKAITLRDIIAHLPREDINKCRDIFKAMKTLKSKGNSI